MHSFALILVPIALLAYLGLVGVWGTLQYKWLNLEAPDLVAFGKGMHFQNDTTFMWSQNLPAHFLSAPFLELSFHLFSAHHFFRCSRRGHSVDLQPVAGVGWLSEWVLGASLCSVWPGNSDAALGALVRSAFFFSCW